MPPEPRPTAGERASDALAGASDHALLRFVVHGWRLDVAVPLVLERVEAQPLRAAGLFPGALVRALMEVPGHFWGRRPALYARYVAALRACAAARRQLPAEERMRFWTPFSRDALAHHADDTGGEG